MLRKTFKKYILVIFYLYITHRTNKGILIRICRLCISLKTIGVSQQANMSQMKKMSTF